MIFMLHPTKVNSYILIISTHAKKLALFT